jgi:hypothetical protein
MPAQRYSAFVRDMEIRFQTPRKVPGRSMKMSPLVIKAVAMC